MARVGVLASGGGTNLAALIEATTAQGSPARIVVVGADRPRAGALQRARAAQIPTFVVLKRDHPDRRGFDRALVEQLRAHHVEWVCLAGFMKRIGPPMLDAFPSRILNIHPALLPAFPGLDGQGQAHRHGVRIAGCTVHLVDAGTDTGPIVAQGAVPVLQGDTEHNLQQRILRMEHTIYPAALRWAVEGRLTVEDRRVHIDLPEGEAPWWFDPTP
ncbi:MAG TPA: phosphoribosylglycinamide formyltransferase [Deltaproteobacteria bacterium]|nr:phosphoribosylglycinamide formyltransferase [Deltaproteobacteria bacterium]